MATSWEIQGDTTPILRFNVASGQSVHVQSGSYMSGGQDMKATKIKSGNAGIIKRYFSGDFITWDYKNHSDTEQNLDVSPKSAGALTAISCAGAQDGFLMENGAFFAMSDGTCDISTQSTKELRKSGAIAGLLSQGFTMQKLTPLPAHEDTAPTLFVESGGALIQYDLAEGEQIKVNKSALFGFSSGTKMELKKVEEGRLRHIFAGEGFSNYVATGPGIVLVESHARANQERKQEGGFSKMFWGVLGAIGLGLANIYFFADEGNSAPSSLQNSGANGQEVIEFYNNESSEPSDIILPEDMDVVPDHTPIQPIPGTVPELEPLPEDELPQNDESLPQMPTDTQIIDPEPDIELEPPFALPEIEP